MSWKSHTDDWLSHEAALFEFDRAWGRGEEPAISEYCTGTMGESRRYRAAELVKIDLEYRWSRGEERRVEQYFVELPELAAEEVLADLVREECIIRRTLGSAPSEAELRRRFGQVAEQWYAQFGEADEATSLEATESSTARGLNQTRSLAPSAAVGPSVAFPEPYELQQKVGQGAFATIWRALDVELGRTVAIKVLNEAAANDSLARQRFVREARILARLQHPNIVPVYNSGVWCGRPYLVSQFISGCSLRDRLADGPLPPREAAALVAQVADGVAYAHGHGIVHRDIKPANVLLDAEGRPMLTDFGLAGLVAREASLLTQDGDLLGTPAYMAPEQISGQVDLIGPRTDVYGLGGLLYHVLTGRRAFEGTVAELPHQIMHTRPPRPSQLCDVPRDLSTITMRCLEWSSDHRYASAEQVAEDLRRWLDAKPISVRPVAPWERMWLWARREPRLAILVALLLVTVGFVLGIAWQLRTIAAERDRAQAAESTAHAARQQTQELLASSERVAGQLAKNQGRFDEAIEHYRRAANLVASMKPGSVGAETQLELADVLLARQSFEEARALLDSLAPRQAESSMPVDYWLRRADLAMADDCDWESAQGLYDRAHLAALPGSESGFVAAMRSATTTEAITHVQRALREEPARFRAHRCLILWYLLQGDYESATQQIERAKLLLPADVTFDMLRALTLAASGNLEAAESTLGQLPVDNAARSHWLVLCKDTYDLTRTVTITLESNAASRLALLAVAERFSGEHVRLLASHGVYVPPRVIAALRKLPTTVREMDSVPRRETAKDLKPIVEACPSGPLWLFYGDVLLADDRVEAALAAFEQSTRYPDAMPRMHNYARLGMIGAAAQLALVQNTNREENLAKLVSAARELRIEEIDNPGYCRVVTIGLLNASENPLARDWARHWRQLPGAEVVDATWHELVAAQRLGDSASVIQLADKILAEEPEHEAAQAARESAAADLRGMIGE